MLIFFKVIVSLSLTHIYRPQRSCGQGNIFTPVCHSVHRRGGGLPQCMLGYPPAKDTPPAKETSLPGRPPCQGDPSSRPTPKEEIEGIMSRPTPKGEIEGDQIQPPHPREADSGIQSMSGRYASYWNAFLFALFLVLFFISQ